MKIRKDRDLKILYDKYSFEPGNSYLYEKYHIRTLKSGSWSLCVNEKTREIFIYSYKFSNNEQNVTNKKISSYRLLKHYAKDLIEDNLIEGYFVPPKGQLFFDNKGIIRRRISL